ncbi:GNAT family N-acetyltransferase [Polaribacter sp. R77954]|uniref:GNAT family N-acetyltransferase n=1 Tax=Polaribacter sp. R77954 TaxID=3093870 RepID=UPI0037CBF8B7
MIVEAEISDEKQLTEIALQSKAFWGYSDDLIQSWTEELTVSEQMISKMFVYKFLKDDNIVGFYILNQPKEKTIELEFLFVLPKCIGKRIGTQLIEHAFQKAIQLNTIRITLIADPNAASFYESKGFSTIDSIQSTIFNRFLPQMQKELTNTL